MEEKIPELEKRENGDYENEPLLEYVKEAAECLFMTIDDPNAVCPSWVDQTFAEYYCSGEIDTSMATAYLEHEDVQNTLEAFQLDKHKFWYLCLLMKDVVRGYTEDTYPQAPTPREELEALVTELLKMEPEVYGDDFLRLKGQWKTSKNAGELTLQVKEEGKKKNEKFTIISKKTLFYLGVAIYQFLEKNPTPKPPQSSDLDSVSGFDEIFRYGKTSEKEIWQVALFHKYMDWFLKKHLKGKTPPKQLEKEITMSNGKKRKATLKVDTNKQHLISRMIYILGISQNEKYDDPKSNLLKNNLKGEYKDPELRNYNSRYYIDFTDC